MRFIALTDNNLTGKLPKTICDHLPDLEGLHLGRNSLYGVIPPNLEKCRKLQRLELSENEFAGTVPRELANLTTLTGLLLMDLHLEGEIPMELGNLNKLQVLVLLQNELTGSVPYSIFNMSTLQSLDFSINKLSGTLPSDLGHRMPNLEGFFCGENNLSGYISDSITNSSRLAMLDLSSSSFTGPIPKSLGNLEHLQILNLQSNNFISDSSLSSLTSLTNCRKLRVLLFSENALDGALSASVGNFSNSLNFSFSELSGEIPSAGPFAYVTSQSFLSNDALCGDSRFNIKPCPTKSTKKSRRKRVLTGLYILLGIGSLFPLSVGFVVLRLRNTKKSASQKDGSLVKGHKRISYYELEQATEGFNEANLLGNGSFSRVYKGILKDGIIFAAKVFHVQLEGAFKSFDTECEVLRNLRHRNLTKVITSCSNLDFKALVLEYMPNGTLDKWLYSHNLFLNLLQRLDIMIDVASAMDYLHNGYSTPVVHCDLKPSNVLLDEEMVAHVSDFGIAKMLECRGGFCPNKDNATIGYIAPEYGQDGIVSTSCDVYSFGIVMMETFTRTRPSDDIFTGDLSIQSWISDSFPSELHKVVDSNLLQPGDEQIAAKMQCLSSIMELALKCTSVRPDARISMKDALSTLKKMRLQLVSSRH